MFSFKSIKFYVEWVIDDFIKQVVGKGIILVLLGYDGSDITIL